MLFTAIVAVALLPQPPLRSSTHRHSRAVVSCSTPADDIAALIRQIRDADAALQALEREQDRSAEAIATKSKLEQSVLMGVAALREAGLPDDQIFASVIAPQASSPPPPPSDPISDQPFSSDGVTNGIILIRDGSPTPLALIHGLKIIRPSTGEGMAECVCLLNDPKSHKPQPIGLQASLESLRKVTPAMFVHVEEGDVLGMLHDATDGAYGTAATRSPAINLPDYFKR